MRILYCKEENGSLAVTDVTSTSYEDDERVLVFYGDDDICIQVNQKKADELTRQLFETGRLDISEYTCIPYDEDVDDEDDEDDEDILEGLPFTFKF